MVSYSGRFLIPISKSMKWMGEWYEEKSQMLVIDNIHLFISTSGPPPLDDMTDYIASLNLNKTEYKPVPVEQVHTWQLGGHDPPLVSTLFPTHNKCVCNQPTYTDLCCMCFPEGYPKIAVLHQIFWIAFWPDTVIMKVTSESQCSCIPSYRGSKEISEATNKEGQQERLRRHEERVFVR